MTTPIDEIMNKLNGNEIPKENPQPQVETPKVIEPIQDPTPIIENEIQHKEPETNKVPWINNKQIQNSIPNEPDNKIVSKAMRVNESGSNDEFRPKYQNPMPTHQDNQNNEPKLREVTKKWNNNPVVKDLGLKAVKKSSLIMMWSVIIILLVALISMGIWKNVALTKLANKDFGININSEGDIINMTDADTIQNTYNIYNNYTIQNNITIPDELIIKMVNSS